MAKKIVLQAPVVNVTPNEVPVDTTGEDINDIIMSSGVDENGTLPTTEHDVNDLILNAEPYVEPETATLSGEWWKRAKDVGKTIGRHGELAIRGATPSLAATTAGFAAGGPVGAAIGTVALPFGDLVNTVLNKTFGTKLGMPSEIAARYLTPGIRPPETEAEALSQAAGSAVGGTASELGAAFNLAKTAKSPVTRNVAEALTQRPKLQLATSAPIGAATQYVYDETGNPIAPLLVGTVAGGLTGLRTTKRTAEHVSQEALLEESNTLFNKAKESGMMFDKDHFAGTARNFGSELRAEGYTPSAYPKIASVLEEMQNPTTPKDFTELSAIRKMIQNAQGSADASERRLASILKDNFDDYILNAPDDAVKVGGVEGRQAWKDARASYSKLKKAEIFDDMINKADIEGKTRYTNAGPEQSLANQLKNLALNKKKMALFTPDEQQAIIDAAKGGSAQNFAKFIGKFAPSGIISGTFYTMLASSFPEYAIPTAAVTSTVKQAAGQQRVQDVKNLAERMRLGRAPKLESRLTDVPVQAVRGAASTQEQKKTKLTDLIPK